MLEFRIFQFFLGEIMIYNEKTFNEKMDDSNKFNQCNTCRRNK